MTDLALTIAKYFSIILQAILGFHALGVQFKDEQGRATRAGRTAAGLIVLVGLVSITVHSLELLKQREERRSEAEQRAKEIEQLVSAASRGLFPIKGIRLSYWTHLPPGTPGLKGYEDRVRRGAQALLETQKRGGLLPGGVGYQAVGDHIVAVDLDDGSPLAPQPSSERIAYIALRYSALTLQFFRSPVTPGQHPWIKGGPGPKPDLTMSFSVGASAPDPSHGVLRADYELLPGTFSIHAFEVPSNDQDWKSTGAIVSVPDLLGSQLWVALHHIWLPDPLTQAALAATLARLQLDQLYMSFPGGRSFALKGENFQRATDAEGYPIFCFTFPKTLAELSTLEP